MSLISLSQVQGGMELKSIIENLGERVIVTDHITPVEGQVEFNLSRIADSNKINVLINGVAYIEGKDYFTINRRLKLLTWTFTSAKGGFDIESSFDVQIHYEKDTSIDESIVLDPPNPYNYSHGPISVRDTLWLQFTAAGYQDWIAGISSISYVNEGENPYYPGEVSGTLVKGTEYTLETTGSRGNINIRTVAAKLKPGSHTFTIKSVGYKDLVVKKTFLADPDIYFIPTTNQTGSGRSLTLEAPFAKGDPWFDRITRIIGVGNSFNDETELPAHTYVINGASGTIEFTVEAIQLIGEEIFNIKMFADHYVAQSPYVELDPAQ